MALPAQKSSPWTNGEVLVWATRLMLGLLVLMSVGLIVLVVVKGVTHFWPQRLATVRMADGRVYLGEIQQHERVRAEDAIEARTQLKIGNRDYVGLDFVWVDDAEIASVTYAPDAMVLERVESGNLHGMLQAVTRDGEVLGDGGDAQAVLRAELDTAAERRERIDHIEDQIGDINAALEDIRLARRRAELQGIAPPERLGVREAQADEAYDALRERLNELYRAQGATRVQVTLADDRTADVAIGDIIRVVRPNTMSTADRWRHYFVKVWEFVSADPRNANTEGGVFPAIFGTVLMVLLMSLAVVPLGVLAALYLHEYAKQGTVVRIVRLAVNNLAGVPSIVFGIFGLGMFVYVLGGSIDALFFPERLPTPTFGTGGILWASLTLALLTVPVVVVSTEEALSAVPEELRHGSVALGATQFQTIWRVVLPSALPGILTGLILAVARGAGEVAPLMLTGVVKIAATLPISAEPPFLHFERKFMHLGFHIYDVGFQSPNVEAATPMVYTTTLLLLGIVLLLNALAIVLRTRLRATLRVSGV